MEAFLTNAEFDGILGLALPGLAIGQDYSILDRWKAEGYSAMRIDKIKKKLFVIDVVQGWEKSTKAMIIGRSEWKI